MSPAPHELDVVAAFRRRLAELPEPRRHRIGVPAATTAVALAAAAFVAVFAGSDAPPAALAITRDATSLALRIADASADPDQMTRELNDAGIRGRVIVVPVGAQDAGTWVVTAEVAQNKPTCAPRHGSPSAEENVRLLDIENAGALLRIPIARVRESSGSFLLVAGRDARAGERTVDLSSPAALQRDVFEPVLGPPPTRLPAC